MAAHPAVAHREVKPTGETLMDFSRQRLSERGSPCRPLLGGASNEDGEVNHNSMTNETDSLSRLKDLPSSGLLSVPL